MTYAYGPVVLQQALCCVTQAQCAASNEPVVVQLVDSGSADLTIRQQEFASLAPAFLGNIPVSAQLVSSHDCTVQILWSYTAVALAFVPMLAEGTFLCN